VVKSAKYFTSGKSGCPVQKLVVAMEILLGFNEEDSLGFGILSNVSVAEAPNPPPPKRDVVLFGGSGGGSHSGSGGGTF
jgi:hypothetical protein